MGLIGTRLFSDLEAGAILLGAAVLVYVLVRVVNREIWGEIWIFPISFIPIVYGAARNLFRSTAEAQLLIIGIFLLFLVSSWILRGLYIDATRRENHWAVYGPLIALWISTILSVYIFPGPKFGYFVS